MGETNIAEVVAVRHRLRRLLVVGVSTRAAAESAARAGFAVTAVDAFGDLDQHPSVHARSLRRDFGVPFSAHAAARVARAIDCEAVAYLSSFENHPSAVRILSKGRALWGNAPAVLRQVRDPVLLMETLRRRGFATAEVIRGDGAGRPGSAGGSAAMRNGGVPTRSDKSWLVKPFQSGGGHGVRRWRDGGASTNERRDVRLPRHCYLQEFVPGRVGSVVFVAAGGRAVPLGVTCQLVGDRAFGAADYRYCGNILVAAGDRQFADDEMLVERVSAIAQAVAEDFQLIGVNGIDFVDCDGVPYAIEVNPRWSASMELVERVYGLSVFGLHAAACADGVLPDFDLGDARRGAPASGKAIVFSRRTIVVGDTRTWLVDDGRAATGMGATVRDVPHPGEQVSAGSPVCTVFAAGRDAAACYGALVERAARVYEDLALRKPRATISGQRPSVS